MMRRVVAVLTVSVGCAACAHHPAPVASTPAPASTPATVAAAPAQPAPPSTPAPDADARRRAADAARNVLTQMTFFDFDKADLSDQDRTALDAKLPILAANPAVQIRVDGNCDDRGSDEYNLALGQRRATASKRYLIDHGIEEMRITVISFGKERPIATGDTEGAWAQNRNDQFEIVSGGDQLRAVMQ
jgi:peptidoglycan-associated lipoprotein